MGEKSEKWTVHQLTSHVDSCAPAARATRLSSNSSTLGSDALSSNASKARIRNVNTLGVEADGFGFVHAVSMAEFTGWKVKRWCAYGASFVRGRVIHCFFILFVGEEAVSETLELAACTAEQLEEDHALWRGCKQRIGLLFSLFIMVTP